MDMDTTAFEKDWVWSFLADDKSAAFFSSVEHEEENVHAFAAAVAEGFSRAVADALDVSSEDIEVTCVHRTPDPAMLDLLTLGVFPHRSCAARRKLLALRALRARTKSHRRLTAGSGRRLEPCTATPVGYSCTNGMLGRK